MTANGEGEKRGKGRRMCMYNGARAHAYTTPPADYHDVSEALPSTAPRKDERTVPRSLRWSL